MCGVERLAFLEHLGWWTFWRRRRRHGIWLYGDDDGRRQLEGDVPSENSPPKKSLLKVRIKIEKMLTILSVLLGIRLTA